MRAESVEEGFPDEGILRQNPPVDTFASRGTDGNLLVTRFELIIEYVQPHVAPVAATSGDTYSESPISTGRHSLS